MATIEIFRRAFGCVCRPTDVGADSFGALVLGGFFVSKASGGLGEALKQARAVAGLSLQEVADRAGLTKAHVWELESERAVNPTVKTLLLIAHATGCPYITLCQAAFNSMTQRIK